MDWSGLPALGYGAAGFIVFLMGFCMQMAFAQRRLADKTLARYLAEVTDHDKDVKRLETELEAERAKNDVERGRRRTAEDKVDEVLREIRSLKAHVELLQQRVTALTAEVTGNHDDA